MNRKSKTYANFITVPLTDDQLARIDAREGKRPTVIRAALDAYLASDASDQPVETPSDTSLRQSDTSDLATAVAIVLRAAESGDLDRADVAAIVAARWDLHDGDRLQFSDGHLYRESGPGRKRRTVAVSG